MKPRDCETVPVKSLHKDLGPVGKTVYVTPAEANFMVMVGRAQRVQQELDFPDKQQDTYMHREMLVSRPTHANAKRGKKD